jgi:hypothetical protein
MDIKQAAGAIAEDLGISVSEVEAMTMKEAQPHIQRLLAKVRVQQRENARQGIVLSRIAELMSEDGLTLQETVDRGIVSEEDVAAAMTVTDEDIDAWIAERD